MKRRHNAAAAAILAAVAVAFLASAAADAPSQANKAVVRRFFAEVYNQRKGVAVVDELFAPDYAMHDPQQPVGADKPGRDALKERIARILEAVPDYRIRINEIVAEGDIVAVRFTGLGTHRGDFMGVRATGRVVTFMGFVHCRVQNGRIVEAWQLADILGVYRQLGVGITLAKPADRPSPYNRQKDDAPQPWIR